MRYDEHGIALWYGTPDAPAYEGDVRASSSGRLTGVRMTIALSPIGSRYGVEVRYRINGAGCPALSASHAGSDNRKNIQFFKAALPDFRVGDVVEYVAVAKWPNGQVPAESEAAKYPSSFKVVAAGTNSAAKPAHDDASAGAHSNSGNQPSSNSRSETSNPASGGTMPKAQLLALDRLAGSTVAQLQKADPTLGKYVTDKMAAERKTEVLRRAKGGSKPFLDALQKLDYAPGPQAGQGLRQIIENGLVALKCNSTIMREAAAKFKALELSGRLTDPADLDLPIRSQPLFQPELDEASLYKLTDGAKLSDTKAARLATLAGSPALVDDDMLAALVADKTLSAAEADQIGLLVSLCHLAGGDADLAIAIKPVVSVLPDLAQVTAAQWLDAITHTKAKAPDGLSDSDYASVLRSAAANLYPSDALQAANAPSDIKMLQQALADLKPLATKNPKIVGAAFDDLDTSDAASGQLQKLQAAHQELQALANRHPGLGLAEVLDGKESASEKVSEVGRRLDVLKKLRAQNPDQEVLGLDLTEGSADRAALNTDGLSASEAHMAIAHLKAAQRVHAITRHVDHTSAIMAAGYASGCDVAMDSAEDFRSKTGLDEGSSRTYHEKATAAHSRSAHAVVSAIDAYDGPFHRMPVGNVRSGVKDHLKSIPGFADLFGSQDYCNCSECQSILGAPAYFVDLMSFIEQHLTGPVFRGKKADDALNLKVRRPDLWKLPLTCDNTNTLVSYLDIINPTLENYIAVRHLGYKGKLNDRAAIERAVYEEALAKSQASFAQPFTLPLEALDIYLEHFSTGRGKIARALGADPATIAMAALRISETIYRQINSVAPDEEFLKKVYGLAFAFSGNVGHVKALIVEDLVSKTGYSRADLEQAATSHFVTKNGAYKVTIRSEKSSPDSVQNDVEKISGLNADALHRLYRFTRLLRVLPWTIGELDLILAQLEACGWPLGGADDALYRIVQILDLRHRWSDPVDQLCALWSPIPATPKAGSLFDRLFNFAPLAQTDGPLPRPEVKIVHAAFATFGKAVTVAATSGTAGKKDTRQSFTARLLAGLQVSDADLVVLITSLAKPLGADISNPSEIERGFALSLENITLLFRHALLARLLNLGIPGLFQLISLAGLSTGFIGNLDDVTSLLGFYDWYQASGYSLDDLGQITHGQVQLPSHYPDPTKIAQALLAGVAGAHSLEFADRVFMSIPGITEAESQQMVAANPSLFQAVIGAPTPTYRLAPTFSQATTLAFADTVFSFLPGITGDQSQQIVAANPGLFTSTAQSGAQALSLSASFGPTTAIVIPDGIALDPAAANAALAKYAADAVPAAALAMNYHPVNVIPSALAGLLSVDAGLLSALLTATGVDLGSTDIFAALQAPVTVPPSPPAALVGLVAKLLPLKVLFGGGGYSADDLSFIQQHAAIFAIADFNNLTITDVRKLSVYQTFAAGLLGSGQTDMTPLRDVLTAYSAAKHIDPGTYDELALLLTIDKHQIASLVPNVTLPATAPEALTTLATLAGITRNLGVGAEALRQIISPLYADQAMAVNAVLGAFRAQSRSTPQFSGRSQPFDDRLRSRKRDGLTDYLLRCHDPQFSTLDDLYNYFLLDVQLEGIMQTSWVVAAISSAQLYVYRCIMKLEQDARDPSDPDHIEVRLGSEPAQEWEWRQNFRVWQANREVFLYPENYILPELRDDQTPLFEDLQSALLQQPIDEQNVLDAYSSYMAGFDQLSKLQIAGSFHDIDKDSASDVLHLFGVTPADPPTFFYRTIENASHGETQSDRAVTYTPWEPVSLQIHCRNVAPIVYLGRLFVFWTQISTAPINIVNNANSIFGGYKHTWRVNYSSLRLDQTWTPPQRIAMTDKTVFGNGDGIVLDPLLDQMDKGLGQPYVYNSQQSFDLPENYFDVFDGYSGDDQSTTTTIVALTTPSSSLTPWQNSFISDYKTNMAKFDSGFSASNFTLASYQAVLIPKYDNRVHTAAVDGYTLSGFQWDDIYPTLSADNQDLLLTGRNFQMRADTVDFYNQAVTANKGGSVAEVQQTVICSKWDQKRGTTDIYTGVQHSFRKLDRYPWCSIAAKQAYIHKLGETYESFDLFATQSPSGGWTYPLEQGLYRQHIASIDEDPDIALINSSSTDEITDAIIDAGGDLLLLQANLRPGDFVMKRLTTTLGEQLCRSLFAGGVDGLLSLNSQFSFGEDAPRLRIRSHIQDEVVREKMDFTGAMGTYFREIFFHTPFLIADQLNSQQNFSAALQWYGYIFDPTADDDDLLDVQQQHEREELEIQDEHRKGKDRKKTEQELRDFLARSRAEAAKDRVWRFIEFRGLDVPSLRKVLTDAAAIEAYEQDPFNPHAIARLRLSAYQKCIVMNYIDVLIEWGDTLFTEFQMETVNEATLLYVRALEILGPRPVVVGDCGEANEDQRTYEAIARTLGKGSDFLVEMETYTHAGTGAARAQSGSRPQHQYVIDSKVANYYRKEAMTGHVRRAATASAHAPARPHAPAKQQQAASAARASAPDTENRHAAKARAERGAAHPFHWKAHHGAARNAPRRKAKKGLGRKQPSQSSGRRAPKFASSVVRHIGPAFCVPPNTNLLGYWDLVEDRLYKIRHGMDITGALRQLSLFAPPIDPMMLVEATAAGLSLDDVQSATSGNVPPYRFTYLIEKARQYASQVQGFGGALLSAIEKRDAQQLEVLRVTQQQNILAMTTATKQADVDAAQNAVDTLNAQLDTAQFRHDYFQGLIEEWLNPGEIAETGIRALALANRVSAVIQLCLAGVMNLIPNLGSPFAITYGGEQLGGAISQFGRSTEADAALLESLASATGLVAGYERRGEGWQHEVNMASKDITQINTQLVGANIRLTSAQKALAIHNKTIAQNQQVADFYTSRFSNIALYTWLATTLKTTYRKAYSSAYAMAKLAEQAYRFERNDNTTILLSEPYWSQAQSGLMAGEMLLGDLQNMERSFIETNYRTPEITQSFSMLQISPAALLNLRQNASCNFSIPEFCFDLFYPGQYCRKIKAVRLTIPCVAGPLANIGATLTLTGSNLRLKPSLDASSMVPIQLNHSVVIATSTAQNDTGVFEFNFRDERYMPFEGAGAISSWKVELPSGFRQFDYQTISDVIVHISYTAQQDDSLRLKVETKNGAIAAALKSTPLVRLFSLRQEFPSVLNRLLHSPLNTSLAMSITANYLPYFVASGAVQVTTAALLLRTAASKPIGNFTVSIDGNSISGFAADPKMGGLWSADASAAFASGLFADHTIIVTNAGSLTSGAPPAGTGAPQAATAAAIDDTSLLDVMLYVEYQLTTS